MNPAVELIKIFESWNYLEENNRAFYEKIDEAEGRKALDLLGQTITLINTCEKRGMYVEGFKESIIEWANACTSPYRATGFGPSIENQTIRNLKFCASMISQLFLPITDPAFHKKREAYEQEIRTLADTVEEDETLNPALRSHMRALLDHILECLATLETTGQFYIQDAFQKLSFYIDAARFQTSNEDAKTVYDSIAKLLIDLNIGVASSLIASQILPAISAG